MPLDDIGDFSEEFRRMRKDIDRIQPVTGGDGSHAGSGEESIQLGVDAAADWYSSIAVGPDARAVAVTQSESGEGIAIGSQATADGFGTTALGGRSYAQFETSTALGWSADALHDRSTAVGENTLTTKADQIRLGRATQEVSIPGRLNVAPRTPSSSADTQGSLRDIAADDNYIYVKTSAGWKRAALSTF